MLPDVAAIDKTFDYTVPAELDAAVRVGTIVRVPLHGRRVGGWVVADDVEPPPGVALRPIAKVTGHGPGEELVELSSWAAWRWAGRQSAFLRAASPPVAVRHLEAGVVSPRKPGANDSRVVRLAPAADRWPLIQDVVARGPALVLVPATHEVDVLAGRLHRAGHTVARLPREWAKAAAGGATVIGNRAAAWAPAPDVTTIIVLDAHDESYREERAPTWDAVAVARERARRRGIPFVAVSPCPTLELLDMGELVSPPRGEELQGWPRIQIVDRRGDDPRAGLYSRPLVDLVRSGARVLCVLNRRGRIKLFACAACGATARCERCDAAVEDTEARQLRCRRCEYERPRVCAACGATRLKALRVGVTRAREELEALAGVDVGEVTGARDEVPGATVLVGTEAVLHRVTRADHVAFLDFDQELLAPRYRAAEEAFALLARAGRIIGGRARDGRVLVQTRVPDHDVLDAARRADPDPLAAAERERRRLLGLPPFRALAVVSGDAAAAFVEGVRGVDVAGPTEVGSAGGRWLIRAPDHEALAAALAEARRVPGRLRIEVDPLRA